MTSAARSALLFLGGLAVGAAGGVAGTLALRRPPPWIGPVRRAVLRGPKPQPAAKEPTHHVTADVKFKE